MYIIFFFFSALTIRLQLHPTRFLGISMMLGTGRQLSSSATLIASHSLRSALSNSSMACVHIKAALPRISFFPALLAVDRLELCNMLASVWKYSCWAWPIRHFLETPVHKPSLYILRHLKITVFLSACSIVRHLQTTHQLVSNRKLYRHRFLVPYNELFHKLS